VSLEELAYEVSIKVGYHPAGYGIYNNTIEKKEDSKYLVIWATGSSCD